VYVQYANSGQTQVATSDERLFIATATAVPGPLPLLGVAAAFGCSRKLRKRIKQAA
jgi:hypothetical protein